MTIIKILHLSKMKANSFCTLAMEKKERGRSTTLKRRWPFYPAPLHDFPCLTPTKLLKPYLLKVPQTARDLPYIVRSVSTHFLYSLPSSIIICISHMVFFQRKCRFTIRTWTGMILFSIFDTDILKQSHSLYLAANTQKQQHHHSP